MFSTTEAFMMALQATAEIKENKSAGIDAGIISPNLSDELAIGMIIGIALSSAMEQFSKEDSLFAGQTMYSFLSDYYLSPVLESFIKIYSPLIEVSAISLKNENISTCINFNDVVGQRKQLGWKLEWNAFREPYSTQWKNSK